MTLQVVVPAATTDATAVCIFTTEGGGSLVVLAIVSSIVLTIGSSDAVHSADPDSKDGCDGEMVLL